MLLPLTVSFAMSATMAAVFPATAFAMICYFLSSTTTSAFRTWTLAFVLASVAVQLNVMAAVLSFHVAPGIEPILVIFAAAIFYIGVRQAAGLRSVTPLLLWSCLLFVLGTVILFLGFPGSLAGTIVVSASAGVYTTLGFRLMSTHIRPWWLRTQLDPVAKNGYDFTAGVLGVLSLFCWFRTGWLLFYSGMDAEVLAGTFMERVGLPLLLSLGSVFVVVALIRLNQAFIEARAAERQRELEKARQEAEETARAKSEFLANMSHEIRTPMNGIVGMIDILAGTALNSEQKDFAKSAMESADALLRLLNDILDFSKMEAGMMETEFIDFDLTVTLDSFSDMMGVKAYEKGIEFGCLVDPDVPVSLNGDPGRLRQILTNLAGNSIKFTDKGEVFVQVKKQDDKGDDGVELLFSVKDTGIGIAKDKIDSLFDSYTQADASVTRKYGGTGLGLAISKQLTELMGGRIWAESEEGQGTTFYFTSVFKTLCHSGPGCGYGA